jgi:hypothetical protein
MKRTRILPVGFLAALFGILLPSIANAWTYSPASTEDVIGDPQISDDGKSMVVLSDVKKKTFDQVLFFNTSNKKPKWTYSPTDMTLDAAISGDGKTVAAVGGSVRVFQSTSKKPIWSTKIPMSVFNTVALSKSGSTILAGDRLSQVHMFKKSSSALQRMWKLKADDGVSEIALSENGKSALAVTKKTVHFIKTDQAKEAWSTNVKEQLYLAKISADGKYAIAASSKSIYFFKTSSKTPVWSKTYKTTTNVQADISDDGSRVVVLANKSAYAYNASGKELWQYDMKSSNWGDIALSGNGKYVAVAQGEDYVYVLDADYGTGDRPFRIYTADRPRFVAFSQTGNVLAYGRHVLSTLSPAAGILGDQRATIPVYQSGDDLTLHIFVTNPGAVKENLKVKIALSLPQINWWDQIASAEEAQAQTPTTRSKVLQYLAEDLPGYSEIYNQSWPMAKHDSTETTITFEMPSMLMPEWLEDFISFLGDLNPLSTLLGDYEEPYQKLTGQEEANTTLGAANEKAMEENLMYPMLGLGTFQLYDSVTNEVYDSDSFYFIYIL